MILSILLVACGDNDEVENPPQNDTGDDQQQAEQNNSDTTNETETDTSADSASNTEYGFTNFDLEADYQETNDALDVNFENEKNDKIEASYEDKSNGIDLNGDEALEELDSIFSSFNFDENTPNEDVLNEVAEAF